MAANKLAGIRCGLAHEAYSAHQGVEHDDANAIAMGAWVTAGLIAAEVVEANSSTPPSTTTRTPSAASHKLHALERNRPPESLIKGDPPMSTTIDDRRRQAEHGSPNKIKTALRRRGTSVENYDFIAYGTAAALYFGDVFFPEPIPW